MTKKKKLFLISLISSFATLIFAFALFIINTNNAYADVISGNYVKINGVTFGSNKYYKNGDTDSFTGSDLDYNAYYNEAEGELTLNNFEGNFSNYFCGIMNSYGGNLKINLVGDNYLSLNYNKNDTYVKGIESDSLTISGDGNLTINISNPSAEGYIYGIYSNLFRITSGTLTINLKEAGDGIDNDASSIGIYARKSAYIEETATVNINIDKYNEARGIYAGDMGTDVNFIEISSSNPTTIKIYQKGGESSSYGLYNYGSGYNSNDAGIHIRGTGKVTINGDSEKESNTIGIYLANASLNEDIDLAENTNVEINDCAYGLYSAVKALYSGNPEDGYSVYPDIRLYDTNLAINNCQYGIYSYHNGVYIDSSNVVIKATKVNNGDNAGINIVCSGNSYGYYGLKIYKNTVLDIIYDENNGLGEAIYINQISDSLIDLTSGGKITIKDLNGIAKDPLNYNAYFSLSLNSILTSGSLKKHNEDNIYLFSNDEGKVEIEFKESHNVIFDGNGAEGSMPEKEVAETQKYELPDCSFTEPAGKRFKCWLVGNEEKKVGDEIIMGDSDITVKALWNTVWNVSFDNNGGTGDMESIVIVEGKYNLPDCVFEASDTNYGFAGWSLTSNGDIIEEDFIDVNEDITLYAIWKEIIEINNLIGASSNFTAGKKVSDVTLSFENNELFIFTLNNIYEWDDPWNYATNDPLDSKHVFEKGHNYVFEVTFYAKKPNFLATNGGTIKLDRSEGKIGSGDSSSKLFSFLMYIPEDLIFIDSEDYDIPNTIINVQQTNNLRFNNNSVTGGVKPYEFSIDDDVPGLSLINGSLYYLRDEKTQPTTATIKVTDSYGATASITINIGAVCQKEQTAPITITATGYDSVRLSQDYNEFKKYKYSLDNGENWVIVNENNYEIKSGVTPSYIKFIVIGDIEKLTTDSGIYQYSVLRAQAPSVGVLGCTNLENNDGIIKNTSSSMEYRLSTDNEWKACSVGNTNNLIPGTYYVREKAFSNNLSSDYVSVTVAEYNAEVLEGSVSIEGNYVFGETLTANTTGLINATGELSYVWKRNGETIDGATSKTYTLSKDDVGKKITVFVSTTDQVGEIIGKNDDKLVSKAQNNLVPENLVGVRPLSLSELATGKITGVDETMEYTSANEYTPVTGSEITGLYANTYFVRFKATDTLFASNVVEVVVPKAWATISFDPNGGSGQMDSFQLEIGSEYELPKPLYEAPNDKIFESWYVGTYKREIGYKLSITGDVTIRALWVSYYVISFDSGDGSGNMESVKYPQNLTYYAPNSTFTAPENQYFYKWEVNGEYTAYAGGGISLTKDTTLKAIYEEHFAIKFDPNGGAGQMEDSHGGARYILPECSFIAPEGKTFKCWSIPVLDYSIDNNPGGIISITKPITIKAKWEDKDHGYFNITFDPNGGVGQMDDITNYYGDYKLPICDFDEPENKEFIGWEIDEVLYSVGSEVEITKNTTIKAIWKDKIQEKFLISFSDKESDQKFNYYVSGEYLLPECNFNAPLGKKFKCWLVNEEEMNVNDLITVTENIEIFAVWEDVIITYIISFDSNGGSGSMQAIAKDENSEYTLPDSTFTAPENKEFKCWMINDVEKEVGAKITITSNVTLKAVWKDIIYTISFDSNGGSGNIQSVEKKINEEYVLPKSTFTAPTGKEFKCWMINDVEKEVGAKITITSNITLKAVWKDIIYTISFDSNGGSGNIQSVEKKINEEYTLPKSTFTAPTGKEFKCWMINDVEKEIGAKITITSNITIKAVWKDIEKEKNQTITEKETNDGISVSTLFNDAKTNNQSVKISVGNTTVLFDAEAVKSISGDNIKFKLSYNETKVNNAELVLDISLSNATFASGSATISIPFDKKAPDGKVAKLYYIDSNGNKTDMNATFTDNEVSFKTNHFSTYAIIFESTQSGISGGAIAGIIIASILVLGIGGFAIYWFVVKRKNFKDLLNIFKKNKENNNSKENTNDE